MPRVRFATLSGRAEDRTEGERALKLFYDRLIAPSFSYSEVLSYYDRIAPTFLENLGSAILWADMDRSQVQYAMEEVARQTEAKASVNRAADYLPKYNAFFDALSGEALTIRIDDVTDIVRNVSQELKETSEKALYTGVATYAIIAGLGIGLALYLGFRRVGKGVERAGRQVREAASRMRS